MSAVHAIEQPFPPQEGVIDERFLAIARAVHGRLLEAMDLRRTAIDRVPQAALRQRAAELLGELVRQRTLPTDVNLAAVAEFVLDEALGLGPLERLLADEAVTEIMVNGTDRVFVERGGCLERAPVRFSSEEALRGVIERIVAPLGRRVDEASPMVDARLPDGSRVNVVLPPLALGGPAVTIRRFGRRRLRASDLVAAGSLDQPMIDFLRLCVQCRRNIVVSGGTGSGKTTLLNALSELISPHERIVTIEDAAELALEHPNRVSLEARPRNIEGRGEVTIRDLVRNALRMRPDRIIVGECRGGEALDMLQAMNTGHDGSLTTVHANSPRDALSRLEVMALMAGLDMPLQAVREQIASAVHIVVQQQRFADGSRRIVQIAEVVGMESGRIQMQPLLRWLPPGAGRARGHFSGCGCVPSFFDRLSAESQPLPVSIFAEHDP
jgi:pilus assembly protein CpaF